jgi:hypothetical protein
MTVKETIKTAFITLVFFTCACNKKDDKSNIAPQNPCDTFAKVSAEFVVSEFSNSGTLREEDGWLFGDVHDTIASIIYLQPLQEGNTEYVFKVYGKEYIRTSTWPLRLNLNELHRDSTNAFITLTVKRNNPYNCAKPEDTIAVSSKTVVIDRKNYLFKGDYSFENTQDPTDVLKPTFDLKNYYPGEPYLYVTDLFGFTGFIVPFEQSRNEVLFWKSTEDSLFASNKTKYRGRLFFDNVKKAARLTVWNYNSKQEITDSVEYTGQKR